MKRCRTHGLCDIRVRWGLHDKEAAEAAPARIYSIFSGDRQIVYAFTRATSAELSAKNGSDEVKAVVTAADNAHLRGKMLHRLAVRAMVADYETGLYSDDFAQHTAIKEAQKAPLIARSLEYGIVTPWTSFVAIEERTEGEQKRQQPSLSLLLERESVDDLPYLGWPQPLRSTERLSAALKAHTEDATSDKGASEVASAAKSALAWLSAASTLLAESGTLGDHSDAIGT